ncbi:CIRH1A family protein [Megaselia abdita]
MKAKENKISDGKTRMHNVRFYGLSPRGIKCMSFNSHSKKLALSRSDASIEIWDMNFAPFLERVIPASKNSSVEAIVWAESQNRLFSAGLTGEIVEWDLQTLQKRYSQLATGSSIWCMAINKDETQIAIGTEEGYINIFDIKNDELVYKTLFDKQEGRILCCKFDNSGNFLVTGSIDVIRIWSGKTGHAVKKMTMSRTESKKETIVWCLLVLKDFTIISGDSRGVVTIFDGKVGAQIESHQALRADCLALAINPEENLLMCTGVDPVIRIYAETIVKKDDLEISKWVKYLQRSLHDHDVNSLVIHNENIISGGVDGQIAVASYIKVKSPVTPSYGPFLRSPVSSGAKNMVLLRYTNYLELWRLGEKKKQFAYEEDERKIFALEKGPEKLLELKAVKDETITSCAISPDGSWIVYSTQNSIRMFVLDSSNEGPIKLVRIKDLNPAIVPSNNIFFSEDSNLFGLVNSINEVVLFKILSNGEFDLKQVIDTKKYIKDSINHLVLSKSGTYLALAGLCRSISVWKNQNGTFKYFTKLPKYTAQASAMAIHDSLPRIAVSFTNSKIFEYDLEEMCFTCSSHNQHVESLDSHCIRSILYDSRNPDVLVMHNDNTMFSLKKVDRRSSEDEESKRSRVSGDENGEKEEEDNVKELELIMKREYKHFIELAWAAEGELLAIGIDPVTMTEDLPPGLRIKKFGLS